MIERCSGQLRMGAMGPVGLDFIAAFQMAAALGYCSTALAELLPAAEAGLMRGIMRRMKKNEDGQS